MQTSEEKYTNQELGRLYQEHHAWLNLWLCRRLGNQQDAADLVQDTFIRLLQTPKHYKHYHPRALLTTIAKNLANSSWHRKKIEQAYYQVLKESQLHYAPSPEQEMMAIQTLSELYAVLSGLSQRQRQVFMLSQFDGLNYAAIAAKLEISVVTVKRDIKLVMLNCLMHIQLD